MESDLLKRPKMLVVPYPIRSSDGAYVFSGMFSNSTESGGANIQGGTALLKVDSSGNLKWSQTYRNQLLRPCFETDGGGYALIGYSQSSDGSADVLFAISDATGNIPEFPSWIVLPLIMTTIMLTVLFVRRKE